MIHIRVDAFQENSKREFACGIGPELPDGDKWVGDSQAGLHHMVDCPGCKPFAVRLGTPISQLSGQPGTKGYDKFVEIANSWGYE